MCALQLQSAFHRPWSVCSHALAFTYAVRHLQLLHQLDEIINATSSAAEAAVRAMPNEILMQYDNGYDCAINHVAPFQHVSAISS